jgi:hypothetical protein
MNSVTVGGPGLVAVGLVEYVEQSADGDWDEYSDAAVWTSVDGIAWSRVPYDTTMFGDSEVFGGAGAQEMHSVTVAGSALVAVGIHGGGYDTRGFGAVWTSADGITWSRVPHDDDIFGTDGSLTTTSVTAGGPGLVAVGTGGVLMAERVGEDPAPTVDGDG